MITLRLRDYLAGERLQRDTRRYLHRLRELPVLRSRETTSALLRWLRDQPGPHVRLGATAWDETVAVPLLELVNACGLTTGGMGSGKTMFALLPIRAMIGLLPGLRTMSFGVLDAKGELFERTLYLLARRLEELQGAEREALRRRIVVIDFSSRVAISPYNILSRRPYTDPDFFVTNRLETLRELLPARDDLQQLAEQRGVARRGVPAFLQPLPQLGQLLVGDRASGGGIELRRLVTIRVLREPALRDGRRAEQVVDATLHHRELVL